jgi:hypothetical protein
MKAAALIAGLAVLVACQSPPERPVAAPAAPPKAPDSLALTAPNGVEVWFTGVRSATDSAGMACTERVMEIRRDGRRIAIPLLYTGQVPRLVNDSTLEVPIWLHCRPGNVYQVSLTTGQPLRVR